jgi:hypothetical protein
VFLARINETISDSYDWQVTVCFYTALHLVNAHLAQNQMQFRRHTDVKHALNPENRTSTTKVAEDTYTAYIALQSLSRRARYLVEERDNRINQDQPAWMYEKHLAKSLRHLDTIIDYFSRKYDIVWSDVLIKCEMLKNQRLKFFKM